MAGEGGLPCLVLGRDWQEGMSKQPSKVNISAEHRHMVRMYMVHHRLPNMQEAVARMIETVMATEGPYTYSPSKELAATRTVGAKAG